MPVVGPRFLIEAGFIVAVAVIAGIERLSTWWIIAVVAAAWVIVAAVEIGVWARHAMTQPQGTSRRPEPASAPVPAGPQPPQMESRPGPERRPERPRIVAVPPPPAPEPEPEPAPAPEREPEPEPDPERVVPFVPRDDGPREWNLWELERAARDHASGDPARDEERSYLLMYLREFAGADGVLPADFDGLVRDAFGELLQTVEA